MHTRAALLKGGDTGAAIDLKTPSDSLLLELLQPDADPHMPPKKQLSEAEIEAVADWLKAGAPWDEKAFAALPRTRELKWRPLPAIYRPVEAVAVAPDGKRLAVGKGNELRLYAVNGQSLTNKWSVPAGRDVLQSLAWHPEGERLAVGGFRRVTIRDAGSGKELKVIEQGLLGRITALRFLDGGRRLALAESTPTVLGRLIVLDAADGKVLKSLRAHRDAIYDLALSPDGRVLCSSSADKLARLWDTETWQSLGALEGHTDYVMAAAFNPRGDRVATVSADSTVKVWEVKTRKQISTFSDRSSKLPIMGIHWTLDPAQEKPKDDADWIITVSEDGRPRLYTNLVLHDGAQRSTGAKLRAWPEAAAGLTTLAFSPAAGQLYAGDVNGGVSIWDIKGKLIKRIE